MTRAQFVAQERDAWVDFDERSAGVPVGAPTILYTCEACGHTERGGRAPGLIWDHIERAHPTVGGSSQLELKLAAVLRGAGGAP